MKWKPKGNISGWVSEGKSDLKRCYSSKIYTIVCKYISSDSPFKLATLNLQVVQKFLQYNIIVSSFL